MGRLPEQSSCCPGKTWVTVYKQVAYDDVFCG